MHISVTSHNFPVVEQSLQHCCERQTVMADARYEADSITIVINMPCLLRQMVLYVATNSVLTTELIGLLLSLIVMKAISTDLV